MSYERDIQILVTSPSRLRTSDYPFRSIAYCERRALNYYNSRKLTNIRQAADENPKIESNHA
jgi:hypothetical protein